MENFTLKIKQLRMPGMDLLRFFSIVLLLAFVARAGTRTDTLYTSGGAYLTRLSTPSAGITAANIDTLHNRHATVDSATIPVLKGHTTKRDSTTFTGGIRGVRLSMDSIFNLTGTAGYVQYLSSTKKFINSPVFTNGTNVAIGKSSVASWRNIFRAVQVGGNSAIMGEYAESGTGNTHYMTNTYYDDGFWKTFVDGYSTMLRMGSGGFNWFLNSGLTAGTTFSPTSIMSLSNTGILNLPSLTASRAVITDGSKNIASSVTTSVELSYLSGVTSAIQTQLNGKQRTLHKISIGNGTLGWTYINFATFTINSSSLTTATFRWHLQNREVANYKHGKVHLCVRYNNSSSYEFIFNTFNMGPAKLPDFYITSDDGITFKVWIKTESTGSWNTYFFVSEEYSDNQTGTITYSNTGTTDVDLTNIKATADPNVRFANVTADDFFGSNLTASRAIIADANKNIVSSTTTSTELALLSGKNSVIDGSGTSGNIPVFTGTGRIGNGPAYNSGTGTVTGNITGKADTARAAGTAKNVNGGTASVTSLTLNGGSALTAYLDTTFYDSLYDNATYRARDNARIVQVGKTVTLFNPELIGTISSGYAYIRGIPAKFAPANSYIVVPIIDNGSGAIGVVYFNGANTIIQVFTSTLATLTGTAGLRQTSISWIIN